MGPRGVDLASDLSRTVPYPLLSVLCEAWEEIFDVSEASFAFQELTLGYRGHLRAFFAELLEEAMGFLASSEDHLFSLDGGAPGTASWELACSDGDARRLYEMRYAYL